MTKSDVDAVFSLTSGPPFEFFLTESKYALMVIFCFSLFLIFLKSEKKNGRIEIFLCHIWVIKDGPHLFGVTPVAELCASKEIGLISSTDGTIQSGSLYDQGKHSQKKLRGPCCT